MNEFEIMFDFEFNEKANINQYPSVFVKAMSVEDALLVFKQANKDTQVIDNIKIISVSMLSEEDPEK